MKSMLGIITRQNIDKFIDEFVLSIDKLSQNCSFTAITALEYKRCNKNRLLYEWHFIKHN